MNKTPPFLVMAEEDIFLGEIYKKRLEEAGYKIKVVQSGEACLREVEKKFPRLVILDLLLSNPDGFRVLDTLKRNSKTESIPVLIFTHLGQKQDVQKALQLGASGYLLKSQVQPEDLLAKIQEILESV